MNSKKIYARGITLGDRGKVVERADGKKYLLRGFQHDSDGTQLTVVSDLILPHDEVVIVHG